MDRRELLGLIGLAVPALAGLTPHELEAATARAHENPGPSAILDPQQRALVDQLSELIIPATDTPGARAARVVDFVEVIVSEYDRPEERAAFLRGLADVESRAQATFSAPFLQLTEPQQAAILTGMEAEARAMPRGSPRHFFSRMKGLTVYGYYTSEVGYTQELRQVLMPGRFDGNVPVASR